MSKKKHTQEQWKIINDGCQLVITADWKGKSIFIAALHNTGPNPDTDASRIVACVNACAGISTEDLEELVSFNQTLKLETPEQIIARQKEAIKKIQNIIGDSMDDFDPREYMKEIREDYKDTGDEIEEEEREQRLANKPPVKIVKYNDTRRWPYSVIDLSDNCEFWLDSFKTKKEAVEFCKEHELKVRK